MAESGRKGDDKELRKGERVAWSTHGTRTTGEVEEKVTSRKKTGGRHVAASEDDPQYKVRSDTSGRSAVHRPESLERKPKRKGS
jgi:hypothetical protein